MRRKILFGSLLIRFLLLGYGSWQDENMAVKYTDVDYAVYTDAALAVYNGGSPYDRLTYRYPPSLAYLMLPNVFLWYGFGKLLFILCDILVGLLIVEILNLCNGYDKNKLSNCWFWGSVWLFHPFSINISTRGNADSITCLLMLSTCWFLLKKQIKLAAVCYGLAVHFRLFPILFAPSILLFINDNLLGGSTRKVKRPFYLQALKERFLFGFISGTLFISFLGLFYFMYGWEFLYESYLYHAVRTDNRHNFSIYFYSLYLQYGKPLGFLTGLGAFVPLLLTQISFSITYHSNIMLCMCLQIMVFVSFNKVVTAQYFLWYTCLLPIVIPLCIEKTRKQGVFIFLVWFVCELYWLHWAYRLEFLGINTFLELWTSSVLFFLANLFVLANLIYPKPKNIRLFLNGVLQKLD